VEENLTGLFSLNVFTVFKAFNGKEAKSKDKPEPK